MALLQGNLNVTIQDPDDEFAHSTCHLDESMIEKAELGKWVELVKYYPRDEYRSEEEKRTELMNKNGMSFWVSASNTARNEVKLTSYAKWEQAFRCYSTIYCRKKPSKGTGDYAIYANNKPGITVFPVEQCT